MDALLRMARAPRSICRVATGAGAVWRPMAGVQVQPAIMAHPDRSKMSVDQGSFGAMPTEAMGSIDLMLSRVCQSPEAR